MITTSQGPVGKFFSFVYFLGHLEFHALELHAHDCDNSRDDKDLKN